MEQKSFILKGDICYTPDKETMVCVENGYLICEDGLCAGVTKVLPEKLQGFPILDYSGKLIVPGLVDLHVHAPQYAFRGLGMDMELLDWLNCHTFPEEGKYQDEEYAQKAYEIFVEDLRNGPNTRACIFGTLHVPGTLILMDKLEESGVCAFVGKVNMDRNSPDFLREANAMESLRCTEKWLKETEKRRYQRVKPILTPRFIPSCTDELMEGLSKIQKEYTLPVQSHLSENQGEITWVKELSPQAEFYGDAYDRFQLFGGGVPTIMAHCVWSEEQERRRMKERGVFIAHCPQSNENLSSGIAPVRTYLQEGMRVGLGSDVAGGVHMSIFRAMSDAIQMSKMRWRLVDETQKPLTVTEAFYLGTKGGGAFFGNVGSFETGYELDAIVLDDGRFRHPQQLSVKERLERFIYLNNGNEVLHKFAAGRQLF